MYFPFKFSRYVAGSGATIPAGTVALGGDSAPTDGVAPVQADNLFTHRISNVNGWPCHRIAVAMRYVAGGTPGAQPGTGYPISLYLWEANTQSWQLMSGISATPKVIPGTLYFFDTVGPLDLSSTQPGTNSLDQLLNMTPGGEQLLVVVSATGAPAAQANKIDRYDIALCADLTTTGP